MSVRNEVIRIFNEILGNSKKISDLPAASTLVGNELVEIVQNGINVRATSSELSGGTLVPSISSWDMSTNAFPPGSVMGQVYYGTISTTSTLLDTAGNPLPSKIIAIALQNNASTSNPAQWIFAYTIN